MRETKNPYISYIFVTSGCFVEVEAVKDQGLVFGEESPRKRLPILAVRVNIVHVRDQELAHTPIKSRMSPSDASISRCCSIIPTNSLLSAESSSIRFSRAAVLRASFACFRQLIDSLTPTTDVTLGLFQYKIALRPHVSRNLPHTAKPM